MTANAPFRPITTAPADAVVEVIHGRSGMVVLAQWDAQRKIWFGFDDPLRSALHRMTGWRPWIEK